MLHIKTQMIADKKWAQNTTLLSSRALALFGVLSMSLCIENAYANPQGGTVSAGQASIITNGNTLDVNQSTNKAVIDWRSFNINANEVTAFHQPSSSALTLNRINDTNPSQILGQLTANGKVILVNPNGVFFGQGSKVDVSGLVATTANITNSDFMAGNLKFNTPGNPNASIINQGSITAKQAGLVGFVAPTVENDGLIQATLSKVTLASGDTFTLDMAGDKLITVAVSGDLQKQMVSNTGQIQADGGTVTLTAAAARTVIDSVVSSSGIIEANSFQQHDGQITLYAEGSNAVDNNVAANKGQQQGNSTVLVSGTLNATGYNAGEKGGKIEILADHVGIVSGASIDASGDAGGGTVRIGGDYHGDGITPTALRTIVQGDTTIKANAVNSGNGGKVIVWADDRTDFAGNIEAMGGTSGGDGGFIETSGEQALSVNGLVNASASHGKAGTWLMDPAAGILSISTGATQNVTGSPNFLQVTTPAVLNTTDIENVLQAGTNVSVTATIILSILNSISVNLTSAATTLTLIAGGGINLESGASITATGTQGLNVNMTPNIGVGTINFASGNGGITTNGGNISLNGSVQLQGDTSLDAGGGNIHFGGSIDGAQALTTTTVGSGTIDFGAFPIGGVTALTTLTAASSSGIDINGGIITTTGNQVYNGPVILGNNTTLNSTGNGNIYFTSTVDSDSPTTPRNLNVNSGGAGTANFSGVLGGTATLNTLSVMGTTINIGDNITTKNGADFTGAVQLTGDSVITNTGGLLANVNFTGAINGAQALTVNNSVGSINFVGMVGGTTALSSLSATSANSPIGFINIGSNILTDGGNDIFGSNVHLIGNSIINTGGYDITFADSIDGSGAPFNLTVVAGNAHAYFDSTLSLGLLAITAGNGITFASGVTATGINLMTDSLTSTASVIDASALGTLKIHPYTLGAGMGIGTSSTGTLKLDDTLLGTMYGGNFVFGDALNTGTVDIDTTTNFSQPITVINSSGFDIVLDSQLTDSAAGVAAPGGAGVVLASGRDFINNDTTDGSAAINLTGTGTPRWIIYSTSSPADTPGGLVPAQTFDGQTYTANPPITIPNPAQDTWVYSSGVTSQYITLMALDQSVTYGTAPDLVSLLGTTYSFSCSDGCTASVLTADPILSIGNNATTSSSGNYNVTGGTPWTINLTSAADNNGYFIYYTPGNLTVNPKSLTVSGMTASNKVYNSSTAAVINNSGDSLVGVVGGDGVTLNTTATATFASKDVANGITVTASGFGLGNTDAGNYTLVQPTATANITPASLTVSGLVANNKVYDRTTNATLNNSGDALVGIFAGDTVTLNTAGASGIFANRNVANGIAVSTSGFALNGAQAFDYTLTQPSAVANITPLGLTPVLQGTVEKTYDGTTTATLHPANYDMPGIISGDNVFLSLLSSGAYDNQNTGVEKTVTVTGLSLSGSSNGNYTIPSSINGTVGIIDRAPLTITANDKTMVSGTSLPTFDANYSGFVHGEMPSVISGLTFSTDATENSVGTYSIVPGNAFAQNYTISYVNGTLTATLPDSISNIISNPAPFPPPLDGLNFSVNLPAIRDNVDIIDLNLEDEPKHRAMKCTSG